MSFQFGYNFSAKPKTSARYPSFGDKRPIKITKKTKLDSETKNEQEQFAKFIELLRELQRKGKISVEEYRDHGKLWREQPQNRETLVGQLKLLLNKQP